MIIITIINIDMITGDVINVKTVCLILSLFIYFLINTSPTIRSALV